MNGREIAAKLREALALMNSEGKHWVQGASRFRTRDGIEKFCSVGAIRQVVSGDPYAATPDEDDVFAALIAHLPDSRYDSQAPPERVISWNDDGYTRWDEVAETFEKAAAAAEQT